MVEGARFGPEIEVDQAPLVVVPAVPTPEDDAGGALQLWLASLVANAPYGTWVHVGVTAVPRCFGVVTVMEGLDSASIAGVPGLKRMTDRARLRERLLPERSGARVIMDRLEPGLFAGGDLPDGGIFARNSTRLSSGVKIHAGWRRVLAAAGHDLLGRSTREVSARLGMSQHLAVPGLHDHELPTARRAKTMISEGRKILHHIEAWPWAQFADGRLPTGRWWDHADVVGAAAVWYRLDDERLERQRDLRAQHVGPVPQL